MGEAAERATAWRAAQRKAGNKPWLIWVPLAFPGKVAAVAHQHHQDVVECLISAIDKYASDTSKTVRLSAFDRELIIQELQKRQSSTNVPLAPVGAEEGVKQPETPPAERMSRCGECHELYPSKLKRCPDCRPSKTRFDKARKNLMTIS